MDAAIERPSYRSGSKNKNGGESVMETGGEQEAGELIPGLPEDVAMECLTRVPSRWHRPMRHVCEQWRRAVGSPEFRRRRRISGLAEDIVFLIQAVDVEVEGDGRTSLPECRLTTVNLITGEWRRVEGAAAWGTVPLFAQCAAAGDGRHVTVVGGWDPVTLCATRDVRVLDVPAGVWLRGEPMPDSRSFFGCAGAGGNVFVAGGHDESKNALRSALAYDVAADAWRALPDMREERDEPQLVATSAGRLLAASGYATDAQGAFKKTAECYTAGEVAAWSDEGDMVDGTAETFLASVGGKLWAVGAGKGAGVREWQCEGGAWRDVADGPPGMKACVKAVGVVGDGAAAVFVFGMVEAQDAGDGKYAAWTTEAGGACWRRVAVPAGFGGFVYSGAAVRV